MDTIITLIQNGILAVSQIIVVTCYGVPKNRYDKLIFFAGIKHINIDDYRLRPTGQLGERLQMLRKNRH